MSMQGFKTFAGAKVQQKNDICKKWGIFLRKMSKSNLDAMDKTMPIINRQNTKKRARRNSGEEWTAGWNDTSI